MQILPSNKSHITRKVRAAESFMREVQKCKGLTVQRDSVTKNSANVNICQSINHEYNINIKIPKYINSSGTPSDNAILPPSLPNIFHDDFRTIAEPRHGNGRADSDLVPREHVIAGRCRVSTSGLVPSRLFFWCAALGDGSSVRGGEGIGAPRRKRTDSGATANISQHHLSSVER